MFDGSGGGALYDVHDEIEAYQRGRLFGANVGINITATWVLSIRRPDGSLAYPNLKTTHTTISSTTTSMGAPTTYGDKIKKQISDLGSVGRSPIVVIKDWKIYQNQGKAGIKIYFPNTKTRVY